VRAICDELAAAGPYLVVMPDFFRGAPWSTELASTEPGGMAAWITRRAGAAGLLHDVQEHVLPYVRARGATRWASVGFCFGGYVSFLMSQLTAPEAAFACGVGVHSSIRIFNFYGQTEAAEAAKVVCPQMLLQAGNDAPNTKAGGDVDVVWQGLPLGAHCVFKEYPDMLHGWVPRGDLAEPAVAHNVAAAMADIKGFLKVHLLT
jgi:dienelactone hydrolase